MNDPILACFFVLAVIFGIIAGINNISNTRANTDKNYIESNNIFTFLFLDKYK